jgi:chemosensory pili system protein ChpC
MQTLNYELPTADLRAIYLPLRTDGLLLPDVTVVEILKVEEIHPLLKSPDWLIGNIQWRGEELPLISFESLNGASTVDPKQVSRIAIINGTADHSHLPYYAVVINNTPSLHDIGEGDIELCEGRPRGRAETMSVSMSDLMAGVPNIEWVEQHLLAYILHG